MDTTENVVTEPNKVDSELVKKLSKEIETTKVSLKGKVYPVKIDNETTLSELISFIEIEAKWKDMEALGIIEVSKALKEQIGKIKASNIFLPNLAVEATAYFLGKQESTGIVNAERHIKFAKAIHATLDLIKEDRNNINKLEMQLSAAENGIDLDESKKEK